MCTVVRTHVVTLLPTVAIYITGLSKKDLILFSLGAGNHLKFVSELLFSEYYDIKRVLIKKLVTFSKVLGGQLSNIR